MSVITAAELKAISDKHRLPLDAYMDFVFEQLRSAAERGEVQASVPFNRITSPKLSDVLAVLKELGYKADYSQSTGIPTSIIPYPASSANPLGQLNIGWGDDYVVGGTHPLTNQQS